MALKKHADDFVTSKVAFVDLDAVDQIGAEAKKMGARQVLLVTDKGLAKAGVARLIKKLVEAEGVQVVPVFAAKPNQYVTNLADGIKVYRSNQGDRVTPNTDVDIFIL